MADDSGSSINRYRKRRKTSKARKTDVRSYVSGKGKAGGSTAASSSDHKGVAGPALAYGGALGKATKRTTSTGKPKASRSKKKTGGTNVPNKARSSLKLDSVSERVLKAVEEVHQQQSREQLAVLQKLVDKEVSVEIDAAEVGSAVGREIKKMPVPQLQVPERKPLSYKATIKRNSAGHMIEARLDPVVD